MSTTPFLMELDHIVRDRLAADDPEASYTARLAAAGIVRAAQKVGEEGVEVALAAAAGDDDDALVGEAADLIYHLSVVLALRGLSLSDVSARLESRHR